MEWFVQLKGDDFDLKKLSKSLTSQKLCIVQENEEFLLKSSDFNQLANADEVRTKAEEILYLVNGSARLALGTRNPITVAHVVKIDDDGRRTDCVSVSDTAHGRNSISKTIRGSNDAVKEIHQADPIPNWIRIAQDDAAVAKALRLLGRGVNDWVSLSRVYDVIEQDIGGLVNITNNGWTTRNQIRRFKHTANSPGAIGDLARHGGETTQPPPDPMSFSEAKSLIETILHNWLRSKT